MADTLGKRLNNPGCVKQSSSGPWKGQVGKDAKGHVRFASADWGIRAQCRIIAKYFVPKPKGPGAKTLLDVMRRYAPADDDIGSDGSGPMNNPSEYAKYVAKRLGVGFEDPLPVFDAKGNVADRGLLHRMLKAMAMFESNWSLPNEIVTSGIDLYIKDFSK